MKCLTSLEVGLSAGGTVTKILTRFTYMMPIVVKELGFIMNIRMFYRALIRLITMQERWHPKITSNETYDVILCSPS